MATVDFLELSITIREQLEALDINYDYLIHDPTPTSEETGNIPGLKASQGVKTLIMESEKGMVMCCVPGDKKLDMEKVSKLVGAKVRTGDRAKIEALGLQIGGIPPIGKLIDIPSIFDTSLDKKTTVWFSCGTQTESLSMNAHDLIEYVEPQIADIVQI